MSITRLIILAGLVVGLGAAENLVPEGDFGAYERDGDRPAGWSASDPEQSWMRDKFSVMAEDGKTFVRIAEPHGLIMVEKPVDRGWQELTLRFESRRQGIVPGDKSWLVPQAEVAFLDADGEHLTDWKRSIWLPADTDGWEVVERAYPVPAGAVTVRTQIGYKAEAGVADFADLSLTLTKGETSGTTVKQLPRDVPSRVAGLDWSRVTGATIDESIVARTLHVDGAAAAEGDGSAERPFATITAAIDAATALIEGGTPTKIAIAAGTYREGEWTIEGSGQGADTLLVIEGEAPGAVTITGTEVFTDWQRVEGADGAVWYEHAWPHDFGFNPGGWGKHNPKQPYEHRSELLFVDGEPQRQILMELYAFKAVDDSGVTDPFPGVPQKVGKHGSYRYLGTTDPADLPPGSFGVFERPENGDKLVWKPAAGVDPASVTVEVATRRHHLWIHRKGHVVLRNLDFHGVAGRIEAHTAVMIGHWYQPEKRIRNRQVLVEDCSFRYNNNNQLAIRHCQDVTLRRVKAAYGAYGGISMNVIQNVLWEDTEVAYNNWRVTGGWSSGGVKIHRTLDMISRNHTAIGNDGYGLWYDISCGDTLVEGLVSVGNKGGFDWEISRGVLVRDSVLVDNHKSSAAIVSGEDVVFERCLMAGSPGIAHLIFQASERDADDWLYGHLGRSDAPGTYELDRLELRDCAIVAWPQPADAPGGSSHDGVYDPGWEPYCFFQHHGNPDWFETYVNEGVLDPGSLWYSPREEAFGIRKSYSDQWRSRAPVCATVDFAGWQQRTAGEARWAEPGFVDRAAYDLRPAEGSPLAEIPVPRWRLEPERLAEWRAFEAAEWHRSDTRSEVSDVIVTGADGE